MEKKIKEFEEALEKALKLSIDLGDYGIDFKWHITNSGPKAINDIITQKVYDAMNYAGLANISQTTETRG